MQMEEQVVLYNENRYVARITLNAPEKGNVVNNENLSLLYTYLKKAEESHSCRLIVIEGKDKVFCRGMDFRNLLANSKEIKKEFSEPYKNVIKQIRNSKKPVIAKIDGDVLAGGMGIALACDIVIATKTSLFGLSEVLFGIIPAYVFPLLLERVPFKKARFLILSSKRFAAQEAFQYGIVDEVVDEENLNKVEKDYIKRLLFSSPNALSRVKIYSDQLVSSNFDEAVNFAQEELTNLLKIEENIKAIDKFLEGEKPDWVVKY